MLQIIALLFFFFFPLIHAEGFIAGTSVFSYPSQTCVERLQLDDPVVSLTENAIPLIQPVVKIISKTVDHYYEVIVNGDCIGAAADQKFYVINENRYVKARDLKIGYQLLSYDGRSQSIEEIRRVDRSVHVYAIAVNSPHNFYVSKQSVLVHNIMPLLAFSAPATITFAPIVIGAAKSAAIAFGTLVCSRIITRILPSRPTGCFNINDVRRDSPTGCPTADPVTKEKLHTGGSQKPQWKSATHTECFPQKEQQKIKNIGCGSAKTEPVLVLSKSKKDKTEQKERKRKPNNEKPPFDDDGVADLTNKKVRAVAKAHGFRETKDYPFNSHGELVFTNGKIFISADRDRHKGGFWKVGYGDGRETFNITLKKRIGK
jgi:hypothetical protein